MDGKTPVLYRLIVDGVTGTLKKEETVAENGPAYILSKVYVLFNDIEEIEERAMKGKLTTIRGVSECDGFYYTLEGDKVLPSRQFLFGKPEKDKDHNLVLFAVSDYDREKNVYMTLKLSVEGRKKGVQLIWTEP